MINVTKTFLPPYSEYAAILKRAWDKSWITNNGELAQELEVKLKDYLGLSHLLFCSNGTVVLQMAIKALGLRKEIITTPFSYVATTTSILWEGCQPVFVDIDPQTLCIDPTKIEAAITADTQAILATHVFGYPCDVHAIGEIAERYGIKIIYDAAHAFGTKLGGRSLLDYGDISTCSFHATKVFHTGEGGGIVCNDTDIAHKLYLYRQFGHVGDDYYSIGINAKNSELHAAMGLANIRYIGDILASRKAQWLFYSDCLKDTGIKTLLISTEVEYNFSYFPAIFPSQRALQAAIAILREHGINPRRYFYPSLDCLPYIQDGSCTISQDISSRVLCLPLYFGLEYDAISKVCSLIVKVVSEI